MYDGLMDFLDERTPGVVKWFAGWLGLIAFLAVLWFSVGLLLNLAL